MVTSLFKNSMKNNMPFFTSKLLQKKVPRRKYVKSEAKLEDCSNDLLISLKLGDVVSTFSNGQWFSQTGDNSDIHKEYSTLKTQFTQLEEENNLLKLKCEILLDMLAQKSLLQ